MPKDGASMRAPMMCWIARMTYPIADPCSFGSIPIYLRQGLNHLNRARFSFSAKAQGAFTSSHLALEVGVGHRNLCSWMIALGYEAGIELMSQRLDDAGAKTWLGGRQRRRRADAVVAD